MRRYQHEFGAQKSEIKKHGIDKRLLEVTDLLNRTGCTPTVVRELLENKVKMGDFTGVQQLPSRDQIAERKQTVKKQNSAVDLIDYHEDLRRWAQAYLVADKTVYDQKG